MNGLSTKLQERLGLSTGGTFLEFVSNATITNDAICEHKERKKRKTMKAPSDSTPPKYWMVYAPRHISTNINSSSGLHAHTHACISRQH
jgi:hypothetical protein